ncbi:hypothetical protein NM688_g1761 [Phlebia brevispora]|uniref:Uncharacterized protein n=1 Tax=Phlebia brevispora TaxID=194682 RepID=A0ACC1TAV1_9APHY|nr:hypothetical protein NM688_g1761 [Phlebia brevispora]
MSSKALLKEQNDLASNFSEQSEGSSLTDVQMDNTSQRGSVGSAEAEENIVEAMHNMIDMRHSRYVVHDHKYKDHQPVHNQNGAAMDTSTGIPPVSIDNNVINQDLLNLSHPHVHDVDIYVIVDIYTLDTFKTIKFCLPAIFGAGMLVQYSYIGALPVDLSITFFIKTLELFCHLCFRKVSFSTKAFSKMLCDYYMRPYKCHYCTLLGDAFDVYLSILQKVDKRVQSVLNCDIPDWHVLNSCLACCYKYKGKIKSCKQQTQQKGPTYGCRQTAHAITVSNPLDEDDIENLKLGELEEGDPTDSVVDLINFIKGCIRNWKSAATEEKKKM